MIDGGFAGGFGQPLLINPAATSGLQSADMSASCKSVSVTDQPQCFCWANSMDMCDGTCATQVGASRPCSSRPGCSSRLLVPALLFSSLRLVPAVLVQAARPGCSSMRCSRPCVLLPALLSLLRSSPCALPQAVLRSPVGEVYFAVATALSLGGALW